MVQKATAFCFQKKNGRSDVGGMPAKRRLGSLENVKAYRKNQGLWCLGTVWYFF